LATQACGLETKRFWLPILWCSLGVAAVSFAAQETIMPAALARSQRLWHERVHPEWEWTEYNNVALAGGGDRFVEARQFRPKDGVFDRPTYEKLGPQGVVYQLDAMDAKWDAKLKRWVFHKGVERVFGPDGVVQKPFDTLVSDFDSAPLDLIPRELNPDEMTWLQVRSYERRVGRFGGSPLEYEVAAQAKLAYPLANLVICALGIPIALRLRKSSRVASFCGALAISFAYLWFMEVGRAMGVGGTIPAWAAAWSANALFGATALVLIRRWDL
ncbi:MAG TPA: LptF/LptG family permease, partial [Elusimicrobiota bacterium]|nr:LptF/LptG family permease [Elusimicrobiota bacterium]